jgi:hypothetical protein
VSFVQIGDDEALSTGVLVQLQEDLLDGGIAVVGRLVRQCLREGREKESRTKLRGRLQEGGTT